MKFIIVFALLVACIGCVRSQNLCRGRPIVVQSCSGGRDEGFSNTPLCASRGQQMWYWDSGRRSCNSMNYRGCGGNTNRYCSVTHCQQSCRR